MRDFFTYIFFFLFISPLYADIDQNPLLYSDPAWLGLLHIDSTTSSLEQSTVETPTFFYSKRDQKPSDELAHTIAALTGDSEELTAQEAVCRFPARYLWLKNKIELSEDLSVLNCEEFVAWSGFETLSYISVSYVGSYLGNPASTFGHVLVRLHSRDSDAYSDNLLDPAINFGAEVPENESTVKYIIKGLFGGYKAGFSSQDYYRHDLVYGNAEQRDIWQYNLALTEQQKQWLVAHLWELQGMQFDYYFLLQNCGFRLAEILEPILGTRVLPYNAGWYAPATLFHELTEIENPSTGNALVDDVVYVPSQQRKLYADFEKLNVEERKIVQNIIQDLNRQNHPDLRLLEGLSREQQARLLDLLVEYAEYKRINSELRVSILAARFRLPPSTASSESTFVEPPSSGTRTNRVQFGYSHTDSAEDIAQLKVSPFYYDGLGRHSDIGSELIFFDLTLDINSLEQASLSEATFLRIRKLNSRTPAIPKESQRSWLLDTGLRRESLCLSCSDFFIRGGIGRSAYLTPAIQSWAFLTVDGVPEQGSASTGAEIGILYSAEKQGLSIQGEKTVLRTGDAPSFSYEIAYRYQISPQAEIRFDAKKRIDSSFSAGLSYYF